MSTQPEPPSPVASRIKDAQRDAAAIHADVERISQAHMHSLLADPTTPLTEHVDDPELTAADRARLLATIRAKQEAVANKKNRPAAGKRWGALPSRRIRTWSLVLLAISGVVIGVPLRNTTERAVVVAPFVTQFEPTRFFQAQTALPGQSVYVRRWLRWTPVAVTWIEDAHTYTTAPMPRFAITFPGFPYLDRSFWRGA